VRGIQVSSINASYVLASASKYPVRIGAPLFHGGTIANLAPASQSETGASIATDLEVAPGEEAVLHFVLAWYAPRWAGSSTHHYVHAYARRFRSVGEVVETAVERRGEWLSHILGWQQALFSEADLPPWLRDQLVNVLHTIAKDSFWAADSIPKELWYGNTGLFALTESPRTTPHMCNPSDWYGNLPIVYFFPDLMLSLLRSYVHFQLPTGEVPLGIGEGSDLCRPTYQVLRVMNSCVHIHLVDRSWQRDGDAGVLTEFYRSARAALGYMRSLDRDEDGLPELDSDPAPEQFYGAWPWFGVSPYVAGFWITAVQMMGRMSAAIGDRATQEMCADWEKKARETLERQLWNGRCYLLFADPSGRRSDTVLANQLVGQWCAQLHGLPPMVGTSRAQVVLSHVADVCSSPTNAGLMNAIRPDGSLDHSGSPHSDGIFTGECLCTTATMMYEGLGKEGSEYARRLMQTVVVANGVGWELPNILNADGSVRHGDDFYQLMILWALPLAMNKESLAKSCSEGFVQRVLNAGRTD
jgi:non-lysosomal glucosylceramidase